VPQNLDAHFELDKEGLIHKVFDLPYQFGPFTHSLQRVAHHISGSLNLDLFSPLVRECDVLFDF
jgi:hypothetical protein